MSSCAYDHTDAIAGKPYTSVTRGEGTNKTHARVLTPTLSQGHTEDPITGIQEHVSVQRALLR